MDLVVTYCSRDKDHAAGLLPALDRYLSDRIDAAQRMASERGGEFRILSGLYGLVAPDQEIPDYDHLLAGDEVPAHSQKVISQMQGMDIEKVLFLTRPLTVDPGAGPYQDVLRMSCSALGVIFEVVEI